MESLEQMGAYAECWRTARKAIPRSVHPPAKPAGAARRRIYERQGAVLLKTGDKEKAAQAFEKALQVVEEVGKTLPLVQTLLRWTKEAYTSIAAECWPSSGAATISACAATRSIPAGR